MIGAEDWQRMGDRKGGGGGKADSRSAAGSVKACECGC